MNLFIIHKTNGGTEVNHLHTELPKLHPRLHTNDLLLLLLNCFHGSVWLTTTLTIIKIV